MKNHKGSVLIISVWTLALLFLLTVSLALTAQSYLVANNKSTANFKSDVVFIACVQWTNRLFFEESVSNRDVSAKSWLGEIKLPPSWEKDLKVYSEDEGAKLNLNKVSDSTLLYLFRELTKNKKIMVAPETAVKRITKYRKKKPFEFLEELSLVEGFSRKEVDALRPYLTVYEVATDTDVFKLNVNVVDRLILKSIIFTLPETNSSVKKDLFDAIDHGRQSGLYFSQSEISEEAFMSKLHLDRTPEMNAALTELLRHLTTKSKLLRFTIDYIGNKTAQLVIMPVSPDIAKLPKILFWHEGGPSYHAS